MARAEGAATQRATVKGRRDGNVRNLIFLGGFFFRLNFFSLLRVPPYILLHLFPPMTLVAMSHRSSVPTSPHLPSKLVKSSEGSVEPLQNLISSHVDEAEIALLPIINFTLNHDDLFSGAITIVKKLFPTWQEANLLLVQCKDGITNKLVKVSHKGASSEPAILIRAYGKGSELLIDRNQELRNLLVLSKLGLGPKVYGRFNNGIAYGFVAGDMFSVDGTHYPPIIY